MNKFFDLRFVIGSFFMVVGILLLVYGFASADANAHSVNRWCGGGFVTFGVFMIVLSFKKDKGDELFEE